MIFEDAQSSRTRLTQSTSISLFGGVTVPSTLMMMNASMDRGRGGHWQHATQLAVDVVDLDPRRRKPVQQVPVRHQRSTLVLDEARDPLPLRSQVTASTVRTVHQERSFKTAHHHRREAGWGKRAAQLRLVSLEQLG